MLPARSGFTLIEIMVVIAIIAILLALMMPAMSAVVRVSADQTKCLHHMRLLGFLPKLAGAMVWGTHLARFGAHAGL